MFAGLFHEPKVERQIMNRGNLHAENFMTDKQMAKICPRIFMINHGNTIRVEFREIVGPLLVFQIDDTLGGEDHAVASVAGRHDAIKHIHAAVNTLEDICRRPDTHKIAGFVERKDVVDNLDHLIHLLGRFADGEPTDGISVGPEVGNEFSGFLSEVGINHSLHDGEISLAIA